MGFSLNVLCLVKIKPFSFDIALKRTAVQPAQHSTL